MIGQEKNIYIHYWYFSSSCTAVLHLNITVVKWHPVLLCNSPPPRTHTQGSGPWLHQDPPLADRVLQCCHRRQPTGRNKLAYCRHWLKNFHCRLIVQNTVCTESHHQYLLIQPNCCMLWTPAVCRCILYSEVHSFIWHNHQFKSIPLMSKGQWAIIDNRGTVVVLQYWSESRCEFAGIYSSQQLLHFIIADLLFWEISYHHVLGLHKTTIVWGALEITLPLYTIERKCPQNQSSRLVQVQPAVKPAMTFHL